MKSGQNIKVEDDDDVVIIGEIMPKPIISRNIEKSRHIEFRKSKSVSGSLVITQKVKVKKRKHRCVLNVDTGMNEKLCSKRKTLVKKNKKCVKHSFNRKSVKHSCDRKSVKNSSILNYKLERFAPVCMRKNCRVVSCKVERDIIKRNNSTKTRSRNCFPNDLKRLLSPVSSSSFANEMSNSFEISLDTSSFQDEKESKLDRLIKRTRERQRNNQATRTQYLFTPPHTDKLVQDKEMTTGYVPPRTSTPKCEKYTENSLLSTNNEDITDTAPISLNHNSFFRDIQSTISPIKSYDLPNTNFNQHSEEAMLPTYNNTKQSNQHNNTLSENIYIQHKKYEYKHTCISDTKYEKQIKIGRAYSHCNDDSTIKLNWDSTHCFDDMERQHDKTVANINFEQNIEDSVKYKNDDLPTPSIRKNGEFYDDVYVPHKKSDYDRNISVSDDVHIQHKYSEYEHTFVTNMNCDQMMSNPYDNNYFKRQRNRNVSPLFDRDTQHENSEYIYTDCTTNRSEEITDNSLTTIHYNDNNFTDQLNRDSSPFYDYLFTEKKSDYNTHINIPNSSNHLTKQSNRRHTPYFEDIKTKHKKTEHYIDIVEERKMFKSYTKNIIIPHSKRDRSPLYEDLHLQHKKSDYKRISHSDTKYKENFENRKMTNSYIGRKKRYDYMEQKSSKYMHMVSSKPIY